MKYPYLLFDADDTLFDFGQAERYALVQALQQYDIVCDEDLMMRYSMINQQLWSEHENGKITLDTLRTERFKRLVDDQALSLSATPEQLSLTYVQRLGEGAFLMEGATALCAELIAKGYHIAIITNGIKEVQHSRISRSELCQSFQHIIVSEEAGYHKPDPGIFDYTFHKLNITDKSQVLMIGDSLNTDIKGGYNYGIDTCWYNPKRKMNTSTIQPTYEITRLDQLLQIV